MQFDLNPKRFCTTPVARGFFAVVLYLLVTGSIVSGVAQRSHQREQTNATPELMEAATLLQSGRLDEAEATLRKLLTANSQNVDAHTLLGVVLDQRGLVVEAEREYHTA